MSNNETIIWQSNFITSGRYEMSALEKNILYVVLSQLKKNDPVGKIYLISTKDISGRTGESINYDSFKKATEKMLSRVIEGVLPNGNLLQISFISHAEYLNNQGVIEIGLSPKIVPFFIDLKDNFTTFGLDVALSLKSIYSKRIYEMLSMYKNFDNSSFTVNLMDFKKTLEIIHPVTGKDKYETFSLFKKNVLDCAVREINGNTDILFSYVAIEGSKSGKGRKPIVKLEFSVKNLQKKALIEFDSKENAPILSRLIVDFKLRKDQAISVMNNHSLQDIHKTLYAINIEKMNGKIKNIGAYTSKTFKV
jgi:plasmid replication initiation protein